MAFEFQLAGAYYRSKLAQANVLELPVGCRVWLQAEPDNRHDPNAIQVWYIDPADWHNVDEHFIGYVPAVDCDDVHPYLQDEYEARCVKQGGLKPTISVGYAWEFETDGETEDESAGELEA